MYFSLGRCSFELAQRLSRVALASHIARRGAPFGVMTHSVSNRSILLRPRLGVPLTVTWLLARCESGGARVRSLRRTRTHAPLSATRAVLFAEAHGAGCARFVRK